VCTVTAANFINFYLSAEYSGTSSTLLGTLLALPQQANSQGKAINNEGIIGFATTYGDSLWVKDLSIGYHTNKTIKPPFFF
jgi:2-methylcitrate dehydratase PrpD